MENVIFWSEIGSGFGESGGTPAPRIPRSTPRDSGNPRHINPASYAGYFLAPKQRLLENSRLLLILCKTDTFSACVRSDYLYRESNKRTKAKHFLLPLPISQGIAPGTRLKRGPLLGVRWRELAVKRLGTAAGSRKTSNL